MKTTTVRPKRLMQHLLWIVPGSLLLIVAANSAVAQSTVHNASMTWSLTEGQVTEPGKTTVMPHGTMISDHVIETMAESTNSSFIGKGKLRVTLTAYTPKKDSHGQIAGIWYVRGKWQLSDIDAPASNNPRYTPGAVEGLLRFELPFDPTLNPGNWSATLRLPQTTMEPVAVDRGRQPMRGKGVLIFDDKLSGELSLDLKLWPQI